MSYADREIGFCNIYYNNTLREEENTKLIWVVAVVANDGDLWNYLTWDAKIGKPICVKDL
jgi:hypothetical protein